MMRFTHNATRCLLGVVALLAIMAVPALAGQITANTSGVFGAGSSGGTASGNTLTVGSNQIKFSSLPNEINVNLANPGDASNITLGVFNATSTGSGSVAGATFTLTVNFTVPSDLSPNPSTISATITGTISQGASGATVVWNTTTLTLTSPTAGTYKLTIEPSTPINAPISPDASRIRGQITYVSAAAVPEPLTLLTLGSGLAGLAAVSARRRKKS